MVYEESAVACALPGYSVNQSDTDAMRRSSSDFSRFTSCTKACPPQARTIHPMSSENPTTQGRCYEQSSSGLKMYRPDTYLHVQPEKRKVLKASAKVFSQGQSIQVVL